MAPRILIVVTSHGKLGKTGEPTGFHYEEMTTPYYAFRDAGYDVEFASPHGGNPPYDPNSLKGMEENPDSVNRFLADEVAQRALESSMAVHQVNKDRYEAIYLPGGHGTMWDFPESSALTDLISNMHDEGKIVAAICHGPAAFIHAVDVKTNRPLVQGKKINSFTDEEERQAGKDAAVPFLLESKLRELGAEFQKTGPFKACCVQDGNLITGQNPMSAAPLAEKIVGALKERMNKRAAA